MRLPPQEIKDIILMWEILVHPMISFWKDRLLNGSVKAVDCFSPAIAPVVILQILIVLPPFSFDTLITLFDFDPALGCFDEDSK